MTVTGLDAKAQVVTAIARGVEQRLIVMKHDGGLNTCGIGMALQKVDQGCDTLIAQTRVLIQEHDILRLGQVLLDVLPTEIVATCKTEIGRTLHQVCIRILRLDELRCLIRRSIVHDNSMELACVR